MSAQTVSNVALGTSVVLAVVLVGAYYVADKVKLTKAQKRRAVEREQRDAELDAVRAVVDRRQVEVDRIVAAFERLKADPAFAQLVAGMAESPAFRAHVDSAFVVANPLTADELVSGCGDCGAGVGQACRSDCAWYSRTDPSPLWSVGMRCDSCGIEYRTEVHARQRDTAFSGMRAMARNAGWRCDADGDLCPKCKRAAL